jgi:hypothetical protein
MAHDPPSSISGYTFLHKKKIGRLGLLLKIALLGGGFHLKSFGGEARKGKEMILQLFI